MARLAGRRRGVTLSWTVASILIAVAMLPVLITLCRGLSFASVRSAHRLLATRRADAELERLRRAGPAPGTFLARELPNGRGEVQVSKRAAGLVEVTLLLTWDEAGPQGRTSMSTLMRQGVRR